MRKNGTTILRASAYTLMPEDGGGFRGQVIEFVGGAGVTGDRGVRRDTLREAWQDANHMAIDLLGDRAAHCGPRTHGPKRGPGAFEGYEWAREFIVAEGGEQ